MLYNLISKRHRVIRMLCLDRIRSTFFLPDILAFDLFFLSLPDNRFLHLNDLLFLISRTGLEYRCLDISGTTELTKRNRKVARINIIASYTILYVHAICVYKSLNCDLPVCWFIYHGEQISTDRPIFPTIKKNLFYFKLILWTKAI